MTKPVQEVAALCRCFHVDILYLFGSRAAEVKAWLDGVGRWRRSLINPLTAYPETYTILLDTVSRAHNAKWAVISHMSDVGVDLRLIDRRNRPLTEVLSTDCFDASVDLIDFRERQNA